MKKKPTEQFFRLFCIQYLDLTKTFCHNSSRAFIFHKMDGKVTFPNQLSFSSPR